MSQYTPPINQTQIEDPFEGSVHRFDDALNTTPGTLAPASSPHVAEGVGPAAGDTFALLDRTWTGFSSPAQYPATVNNLTRVDYMQVSHRQEAVRQNESASYYLEAGAAVCPPESDPAGYRPDQARQQLAATDNVIKIGIYVYAVM